MYLLYISKNTIEIFKKYQKIGELAWTPETLSKTLSQIKSNFSSKFRIILSDQFITVSSLLLPPQETRKRDLIQSKIQPLVSQDLSQTIWDYKIVAKYNRLNLVQVIFVSSKFFNIFRDAIQSAGIKVALLESFSTTICRFISANKLTMVNYQDLLVLSFNRTPIYSHLLSNKLTQLDIDQVFEFSQKYFQTLPQQILFSPAGDVAFNQFDFSGIRPEYTNLNPLKGIIHSSNALGSDPETSRLDVTKINKKSSSFLPKIMVAIPLILFLIIFIFVVKNQNINNASKSSVSSITPTIIPTPTEIPLSSIKIQVLNGTGISGQAAKITDLLAKNDFKVESVGNANNYDFTQTQIETKSFIPSTIVNLVKESLKDDYPAKVLDTNLSESSEFDIVITTGE